MNGCPMDGIKRWWPMVALLILAVGVPCTLYRLGFDDPKVEAVGAWFGAFTVICVGLFAIPQLGLQRASVDTDIFLKATSIIDDEAGFGRNYKIITFDFDAERIKKARLADDGTILDSDGGVMPSKLSNAAWDVLYALEQVGIIFHYATNKAMIEEYAGEVVINAHEVLASIIKDYQKDDASMYERFDELYVYCVSRWNRKAASKVKYTNV